MNTCRVIGLLKWKVYRKLYVNYVSKYMTLFKDILTSQDLIIELLFITLYPVNLRIIIPKTRCIGFFTTFVLLMLSLKSIGQLQ